jgi:hypothetical protein
MSIILTEVDEFTANVQAPEGNDQRNSLSVRTALQPLANRTRHHQNILGVAGTRKIPIRLNGTSYPSGSDVSLIQFAGVFGVQFASNSAAWMLQMSLPDGVTLNFVQASVTQGNASASGQMSALIFRNSRNLSGGAGTPVQLGSTLTFAAGAADRVDAISVVANNVIDNELYDYFLQVNASALAATNVDILRWAVATVSDPRSGIKR